MAFSPTNFVCAPISVEHARKQNLRIILDIRFKLSCSQALCAHVRADYAHARILYTMMPPAPPSHPHIIYLNAVPVKGEKQIDDYYDILSLPN